jgi:DNA repair exonuclease SbcCD ATPase subunit
LYFDKLEIVSFKAYRQPQTINFEKMGNGLWFVSGVNLRHKRLGSNGAAKSSIFDCIAWVLYGQTIKGTKTTDVRGWESKDPPEASLTVCVDRYAGHDLYVIKRKGVTNGLWIDGKGATQEDVDRLIGLTYPVFLHTIIFGQGKDLFFDLPPTKKMAVLSETLILDKWDDRIKLARDRTAKLQAEWAEMDGELRGLDRLIETHEKSLDDLKAKSRAWEDERAEANERRVKDIADKERVLVKVQDELDAADLAYDSAETELRASQKALDRILENISESGKMANSAAVEYQSIKREYDDKETAIKNLLDGDTCPSCGQELDRKAIARHRKELDKELDVLDAKYEHSRDVWKAARDVVDQLRKDEARTRTDIKTFRDKSNDAIDARTRAQSKVNEAKAALAFTKTAKETSEDKDNPYASLIAKTRKDLGKAKADAKATEKEMVKVDRKMNRTKYWIDGFKQVRLYLIEDTLAELEAVTQTMLSSVGLDDWRVQYSIEKENKNGSTASGINVNIYQPDIDKPIKWELFSGGEGQRLRLVGAFALADVLLRRAGVDCDFMVFDEPTRHLSPEGVRDTIELLVDEARRRQIFYVDHQAVENRRFAGRLVVTRGPEGPSIRVVA